ncbi:MAG: acyl carrier protein [Lachnospiraceae bacterium]|nr:acyl carrier protein [Lachnospiraceae bacterium]MDN4742255.1 acyl carrier protein [Lachnospiraceae bacterium C1.1]
MTRDEAFERLTEVFRDVFDDEEISISEGTTSADIADWDSFEHINLILAVENEFNIKIPMGKAVELKNVGELVDTILASVQ